MSGEGRDEFAAWVSDGDVAAYARGLYADLKANFTGSMGLLRNPNFQNLLATYRRKEHVFVVSNATEDEVSSEWLVKGSDGKEYKPDDYLVAFSQFVAAHEADIEAIGILLKHPQDWNPEALHALRQKLAAAPQRFTIQNLQRAHEVRHKKPLVDIISMVKHAADEESPLR